MEYVYIVYVSDADGTGEIVSVHKTYNGAYKSWNDKRLKMIAFLKKMLSFEIVRGYSHGYDSMYVNEIKKLSCTDSKKINNYPQETPYILQLTLEE